MKNVAGFSDVNRRVLMVGVDAMSLEFVLAHLDHLPVMRSFVQSQSVRRLNSSANLASASVWPTFATGEDPGVHGNYYPFQWNADKMRFERTTESDFAGRLDFEPFWRKLAQQGTPYVVFDAALPLDPVGAPGVEVAHWSAQSSGQATASHPAVLTELRRQFGRRPIGKEVPVPKSLEKSRQIRDAMIKALARKTDAAIWMMDKFDWRLFVVGFYEIHRAGHNLLVVDSDFGSQADQDALLSVYIEQDRQLGRLLRHVDDGQTTQLVFSLHGMAPNRAQDHFLEKVLRRLNDLYCAEQGGPPRQPKGDNIIAQLRAIVPFGIQQSLAEALGERVQDWVVNRTLTGGKVWRETPSFRFASGGETLIRFNIKGREREGYFDSVAEAKRYGAWLAARLAEIKVVETGEQLYGRACFVDAAFPGERSDFLPDLFVATVPSEPAREIWSPAIGSIKAHLDTGRGGNHTDEAFIAASGPNRLDYLSVHDIKDIGGYVERLLTPIEPNLLANIA